MSELPEGWTSATIAEVTQDIPNVNPEHDPDKEFGYVDISSVNNSNYSITEVKKIKGANAPSRAKRPVQANDVLFSNVRTYLRNIAIVPHNSEAQICSTGFTVLRSTGSVDSRYLFRWLLTDTFIKRVTPQQTGTHYPATSDRVVKSETVPLPPLSEQRRIVAKLEKLLSRVGAAQARLATIPRILKRFRQSVLAAASSGQLTADWRYGHPYPVAKSTDGDWPYALPESWSWRTFKSVSREITVGYVGPMAKEYAKSGVPFLRSQNVRPFCFDPTNIKYISPDFHRSILKSRLNPGDVAIVRSGNSGIACVIPESLPEANCSDLVILRPNGELDAAYACLFMNSTAAQAHVNSVKVGIAQGHFNVGSMKTTLIPLPPIAEQQEIVRRVEALFKTADALQARYLKAKTHVDKLTQSILARAFRGELVTTEAELARQEGRDYEPASALLERIRRERARNESAPKPKSKRPSKPKKQQDQLTKEMFG
ncbi:MAG TPA: restriction endonuclease subunit S [Pyrinomonadaceae bacterium]|nr:restriction endonuclease subunit S [Pyrinomonadaceae bacterium]